MQLCFNNANGLANSVDSGQTAPLKSSLIWVHVLFTSVCPKLEFYGLNRTPDKKG